MSSLRGVSKMRRYTKAIVQVRSGESRGKITAGTCESTSLLVCNAVRCSTRLDTTQYPFLLLLPWVICKKKWTRDIDTAMTPCSFEAGQEGFYRIKHPAFPFRLAGAFEGAVGMRIEDECLTNTNNRHFVQRPKCKLSTAETPCASVVDRCWQLLARAWICLGYPAVQPCLSPSVVLPRSGEGKGTNTPSRLASTAGALLYPPLLNTTRAAPWDLTNPLLFQGLRVLAVLLIPPAPFFFWLLMLGCIGLSIPRNFLQSSLSGTHWADLP